MKKGSLLLFTTALALGSLVWAGDGGSLPAVAGVDTTGTTIATRFIPPQGFLREEAEAGTCSAWSRSVHLLPAGAPVKLYDGSLKRDQRVHAAVLDVSVGRRDLQQCADAVMRLRAEHLFATGRQDAITFHFTNGFPAEWKRWRNGERIEVTGDHCRWRRMAEPDASHDELLRFLNIVFTYAGTLSLEKELVPAAGSVRVGDVFIVGGSPGHAMLVIDAARSADGRTAFLLAQSYMPAQQIHVVVNPMNDAISPWFVQDDGERLHTPEWSFDWSDRKRFTQP